VEGQTDGRARLTLILASGASLCAGALGGFLAAHFRAKKDFEARVSAEVEEVKAYYHRRLAVQVTEAEQRGIAIAAAAAMAVPGPGDHQDEREAPVGPLREKPPGPVPYHHPSGIPAAPPHQDVPDAGADDPAGGGDPPEGLADTATEEDDPAPWPAENPADRAHEPDVPSVENNGPGPVIITRTEFYEDEGEEDGGYQKISITYYEGDGVLADDKDVPIRDSANLVGPDFAAGFGNADDPDIVYVRNNRVRIDFEIVRSLDGYAEKVLNYGRPK
jgi:hypothetical protein